MTEAVPLFISPLPCPFCGGTEFLIQFCTESSAHPGEFFPEFIKCKACQVHFQGEGAHARWNIRAPKNPWHYPKGNDDLDNMPAPGQLVVAIYQTEKFTESRPVILCLPGGDAVKQWKFQYAHVLRWCAIPEE